MSTSPPVPVPMLLVSDLRQAVEAVIGRTGVTWLLTIDRATFSGVFLFDDTADGDALAILPMGHVGVTSAGTHGPDISRAAAALDKIVVGGGL